MRAISTTMTTTPARPRSSPRSVGLSRATLLVFIGRVWFRTFLDRASLVAQAAALRVQSRHRRARSHDEASAASRAIGRSLSRRTTPSIAQAASLRGERADSGGGAPPSQSRRAALSARGALRDSGGDVAHVAPAAFADRDLPVFVEATTSGGGEAGGADEGVRRFACCSWLCGVNSDDDDDDDDDEISREKKAAAWNARFGGGGDPSDDAAAGLLLRPTEDEAGADPARKKWSRKRVRRWCAGGAFAAALVLAVAVGMLVRALISAREAAAGDDDWDWVRVSGSGSSSSGSSSGTVEAYAVSTSGMSGVAAALEVELRSSALVGESAQVAASYRAVGSSLDWVWSPAKVRTVDVDVASSRHLQGTEHVGARGDGSSLLRRSV